MDWFIAALMVAPAAMMLSAKSTWLVDYAVYIVVFNRGIRRMVDYYINGSFNPFSPISLTPLLITGLMLLPLINRFHIFPEWTKRFVQLIGGAITFAFIVGFLKVRLAAVYSLAEVLAPMALFAYAFALAPSITVRDRWIRSFSWAAVLVSMYGWFQYLTIPPWDKMWLIQANMVGYMGIPEPTKMTVFSTMAERGVLAGFLGFSIVPMIVAPRWRTPFSWIGVALVFSVILLTLSRGGIIIMVTTAILYVVVNRGAGSKQIILMGVVLGAFVLYGVQFMPNADRITTRFDTLNNMQKDGSFQGRTQLMQWGVGSAIRNPVGLGLGSTGLGTRVNTGTMHGQQVQGAVSDAGYLDIILTYGIVGFGAIIYALFLLWKRMAIPNQGKTILDDHIYLGRAMMISLIIACNAGNFLMGFSVIWLIWATATAPLPRIARRQEYLSDYLPDPRDELATSH